MGPAALDGHVAVDLGQGFEQARAAIDDGDRHAVAGQPTAVQVIEKPEPLGLAFGLGSRDVTRNILAGFYARKTFDLGKEIEIRGERGELKSITPTQTLFQQGDRVVAVANSVFLEEVVKQ